MSDTKKVLDLIKEHDVKYVDFRFTDPRGKWQHIAQHVNTVDEDDADRRRDVRRLLDRRLEGDQRVRHDPDARLRHRRASIPSPPRPPLIVFCDVLEPLTGQPYARDPRSIAKHAEAYLKSTGIGDTAYVRPRSRVLRVRRRALRRADERQPSTSSISEEGPYLTGKKMRGRQHGHRPPVKGGYFPVPPVDAAADLRAEMLTVMPDMGVEVEKHHHEVAPSQHELGIKFDTLVKCADNMQIYKYVVHNVAHSYGKTATFMPKPIKGDNGSGMHVHQSIWKDGKPLFAGNGYADLSETALYYIGGIIKHAKALNAFTNPPTNSYKRLIPGFEAPVLLAYSSRNRSASCRIPYVASPKGKRVEVRFPDPAANPYLAFAAMLMAGLDGIQNKIHPGDPMDKNLYDLPPEELKNVPTVCGSLREALQSLAGRQRLPDEGRRLHRRPDRRLHRAEVGRGLRLRAQPASDRIQDVLLGLSFSRGIGK